MIYLNHAGTSWPKPESVVGGVVRALEASPAELSVEIEQASSSIARHFGLQSVDGLLFTPGCTSALALSLSSLPWSTGDAIVTSRLEHHAVDGVVQRLVRDQGAVHEAAPYRPGEPFDLEFLRNRLRRGDVRLVAFTAASNVTGEILPAAEIIAVAHEFGALCLLDAAQTAGVVPIDAARLGADIVCIAGHKGPLGPQGIGVLHATRDVRFACPSAVCSLDEVASGGAPGYCDSGGMNLAGVVGLAAGLAWIEEHSDAPSRARTFAAELVAALRGREGVTVFGGDGPRTAAVSLQLEGLPVDRAERHFADRGITLRAGAHCAPRALEAIGATEGTVRVSFGATSARADLETAIAVVDETLAQHRR